MPRIIIANSGNLAVRTADLLEEQLRFKKNSVIGLATGSTPIPFYRECVARVKEGRISFQDARTFNLDEYTGLSPSHPQSYRAFMDAHLFDHIDIRPDRIGIPCGHARDLKRECERYDRELELAGGIDWQLIGIGRNGHIGFNEPGAELSANTHVVKLTESTREANARFFENPEEVPSAAITMGMGSILKAKRIVLIATGRDKAEAIEEALTGPITTLVPASFLQLHPDVVCLLDEQASSRLPAMALG